MLETERLILRNFRESDLEDFIELTSNKKVCEMCNWPYFVDREILKYSLIAQTDKPLHFAIVLKQENKVVGAIELLKCEEETTKEIAFMLNEKFWGKGIMTEALSLIVDYAFNDLNIETLIGGYFEGNERSFNVQEKVGFKKAEGREKHSNKNLIRLKIIKDDYKKGHIWQGKQKIKNEF